MVGSGYLAMLQTGMLAACRKWNCTLAIKSFELQDPDIAARVEAFVSSLPLRGVILPDPLCNMPELLQLISAAGLRAVRIAPPTGTGDALNVGVDNRQAAFDMTTYLIGLGHRRIAFIKGPTDHNDANARLAGFRDAMNRAGLPIVEELCVQSSTFDHSSGLDAAKRLLSVRPLPSAVFACNDEIAVAVLDTAIEQGLSIPDDLSLAGFDDAPVARTVTPALTTCRQKMELTGYTAVDCIVNPPSSAEPQRWTQAYELIIRQSTAQPARRLTSVKTSAA